MRLLTATLYRSMMSLVALFACLATLPAGMAKGAEPQMTMSVDEFRVLELLNVERAKLGLAALKPQAQLTQAAQTHSSNMARTGIFSHDLVAGPGDNLQSRIAATGITWYSTAGENISMAANVDDAVNGWMNSTFHRNSILSSAFGRIGISVVQAANGVRYWTTVFSDAKDLEGGRGEVILPNGTRITESNTETPSNDAANNGGSNTNGNGTVTPVQPVDPSPTINFGSLIVKNHTVFTLDLYTVSNGQESLLATILPGKDANTVLPLGTTYVLRVQQNGQEVIRTSLTASRTLGIGQQ